jgi:hypothetical protein
MILPDRSSVTTVAITTSAAVAQHRNADVCPDSPFAIRQTSRFRLCTLRYSHQQATRNRRAATLGAFPAPHRRPSPIEIP